MRIEVVTSTMLQGKAGWSAPSSEYFTSLDRALERFHEYEEPFDAGGLHLVAVYVVGPRKEDHYTDGSKTLHMNHHLLAELKRHEGERF